MNTNLTDAAFVVTCIIALYLGLAEISLPRDKLIHFIMFFILTTLFYWLFETNNRKALRVAVFVTCVVVASIGSEFLQNAINPLRLFDYQDILGNQSGSLLALIISDIYNKKRKRSRVRSRLIRTIEDPESQHENLFDSETNDDDEDGDSSPYELEGATSTDQEGGSDFVMVDVSPK